jgi:two-component system sensor histidine kinase YesM
MLIYANADSETTLYVVDENRRVIASGDRVKILKTLSLDPESVAVVMKSSATGARSAKIDGKEVFLHYAGLDVNHWKLFLVVPKPHYMKQVFFVRDMLLVVGGVFLLFLLAAEGRLARQIARPLESIVSRMNSIRELKDIGNGFEVARRDGPREITELADNFAGLLSRIDALNSRIDEEGKVKRQAELHALQVQVNPHFIYNSLDSIRWLTLAERKDETIKMIDGLSRFFRLGLSGGREKVRICHEIEHVESYLEVQKIRFAERLEYMIDVEPGVLGFSILKIVLQPLVENSLTHGMKGCPGIFVKVRGGLENGVIRFEVVDNGCGMDEGVVSSLNLRLAQALACRTAPDQDHGFGLCNVDSRIKLHYGMEYGLRLSSREGTGTKVVVRIPAEPWPGP